MDKIETKIDKYEVMLDEYHTCIVYDVKYKDVIMSISDITFSWISYQTFGSNETAVAVSKLIEEGKIIPFSITKVRRN